MSTTQKEAFEPSENNPFIGQSNTRSGTEALDEDLSQRARAFVDQNPDLTSSGDHLSPREKRRLAGLTAGAVLLGAGLVAAGPQMAEGFHSMPDSSLEFSQETTTYTTESNDGWDKVVEHIQGIDQVNKQLVIDRVKGDPANIDVLTTENGGLEVNQQITIPVSVEQ
ncbi:hypothetical protein LRY29_01190 [Candidatus Saccharibacteria bacterium]|nr:hypothetical protein [Candidatus Saccharibacteria bacterium]